METTIKERLSEIGRASKITLLYACESGSRGWQFPSPDSDYDVRFIYVREMSDYLSVTNRADHLSFPVNDELDIYGWDLRKVLQLMLKSNTTPFEWLQSPIVYQEAPGFRDRLWALCQGYFSRRSNTHHYLGIAKGALETAWGDRINIKKLFYVLRPLLAARWCMEKQTIAPMTIGPLMTLLPDDIRDIVSALIVQKATAAEGAMVRIDPLLHTYIVQALEACSAASKDLPAASFDRTALDTFFQQMILHP